MSEEIKWQEKVWGKTLCEVFTDNYARHRLKVDAGGFCSFHYHFNRANRFIVSSGVVRIVWCFGWEVHYSVLHANSSMVVNSMLPHQFQVLKTGSMVEEYWPDRTGTKIIDIDDIIRLTHGGKIDSIALNDSTIGILKSDGTFWETGE